MSTFKLDSSENAVRLLADLVGQSELGQDLIGVLAKLGCRPGRQPLVGAESKRRTDGPVPTETRMIDLAGEVFRH